MSKIAPYHTIEEEYPPHREVYHDHNDCHYGKDIKQTHRLDGKGGRPRCSRCAKLG